MSVQIRPQPVEDIDQRFRARVRAAGPRGARTWIVSMNGKAIGMCDRWPAAMKFAHRRAQMRQRQLERMTR